MSTYSMRETQQEFNNSQGSLTIHQIKSYIFICKGDLWDKLPSSVFWDLLVCVFLGRRCHVCSQCNFEVDIYPNVAHIMIDDVTGSIHRIFPNCLLVKFSVRFKVSET